MKTEKATSVLLLLNTAVELPHTLLDTGDGGKPVSLTPYGTVSKAFADAKVSDAPKLYAIYDPKSADHKAIVESKRWSWRVDYLKDDALKEFGDLNASEREVAVQFLKTIEGKQGVIVLTGEDAEVYKELMKDEDVQEIADKIKKGLSKDKPTEDVKDKEKEKAEKNDKKITDLP